MEQQNKLPIKTKITSWGMIITGVALLLTFSLFSFYERQFDFALLLYLIFFSLEIYLGFFLLKKKRWAWKSSVIIFALLSFFSFSLIFINLLYRTVIKPEVSIMSTPDVMFIGVFLFIIFVIPLILLLSDHRFYRKKAQEE